MYRAIDVARYIVNYTNACGDTITNLKLQKLLYFVQGCFLILREKPCFKDKIEAWDFGPVVPNVYYKFREYGSNSIPTVTKIFVYNKNNLFGVRSKSYDDSIISRRDKLLINEVVDVFRETSATTLVKITHDQSPWKSTYKSEEKHNIITQEQIKDFFSKKYLVKGFSQ